MSGAIKRSTTKDQVTQRLREQIASGDLAPGVKLNQKAISDSFGISMTPVREAFEQLTAEGLLKSDAFKGVRVTELSADEYQEIYLQRAGLDALAHRLGAERVTDAQCDVLAGCLTDMEIAASEQDVIAFVRHDRRFHDTIYLASGRGSLRQRLLSLRIIAERYTRAVLKLPTGGMADTIRSHRSILKACRKRDGNAAEKLMSQDLLVTYQSFAKTYTNLHHLGK